MKRIIIICEGQTETEFCKDVLFSHFLDKDVLIQTPLIKKSGGGIVPWPNLKKQIVNHLTQDKSALVSTLIDYYGIKDRHVFPKWDESKKIVDKTDRMELLEIAMQNDVESSIRVRFKPYIQLHEFEGLLFSSMEVFINNIPEEDFINKQKLADIIRQNPNPEFINDNPITAPSARLKQLIRGYHKIVHGSIIAKEIGLVNMRNKAIRFNEWITLLESFESI